MIFMATTMGQFLLGLFASTIPVDPSVANEIKNSIPPHPDAYFIFSHNLIIASPIFVPGAGLGWMSLIIFQTGLAFSALGPAATVPVPGWSAWLAASSEPFFWLEIMAYSAAATASTMLFLTLILDRKKLVHEISRFFTGGLLYALFLWNAASIELTSSLDAIYLEWLALVLVGMTAIYGYSILVGPPLSTRNWIVLLGLVAVIAVLPFLYVPLTLAYLAYLILKSSRPTRMPVVGLPGSYL